MCLIKRCFNEPLFIGAKVYFFLKHAKYFHLKDKPFFSRQFYFTDS